MEKNKKSKLKKIVKKLKSEAAKNISTPLEVHSVEPAAVSEIEGAKLEKKTKKTKKIKGGLHDGKKEKTGERIKKQAPEIPRTDGKTGEDGRAGGDKGSSIWPWEW